MYPSNGLDLNQLRAKEQTFYLLYKKTISKISDKLTNYLQKFCVADL